MDISYKMSQKYLLKDGEEIDIETWDFQELQEFVSFYPQVNTQSALEQIRGFKFLGQHYVNFLRGSRDFNHRCLVALHDDDLLGMLTCQWVGENNLPFWRYQIAFIETHEDHQNKGVGTRLANALDKADFLKGKILQRGHPTHEGILWIRDTLTRELRAEDYSVIPSNYSRFAPPTKSGVYDPDGNIVSSEEFSKLDTITS